jgi:hypothetical protein
MSKFTIVLAALLATTALTSAAQAERITPHPQCGEFYACIG